MTRPTSMPVIGLCRFSYPAIGGFQVQHETTEERRRYLYAPTRLEERFRLFEASTLPCFRNQTDQAFQLLILIGECLPKPAHDRLRDLTAGMSQVRIIQKPPARHRRLMKEILNDARADPDQPCLQFRHDDDDAVSVDFVERLRQAARDCAGLMRTRETVGIDFNCGYLARMNVNGVQAKMVHRPLVTAGLGMYVRGGSSASIMSYTHNRLGRIMPVVSYPDAPMWVRSLNGFNDSPATRNAQIELKPLDPADEAELRIRFAIDIQTVRRVHTSG